MPELVPRSVKPTISTADVDKLDVRVGTIRRRRRVTASTRLVKPRSISELTRDDSAA
jgi:hypothetical protein